MLFRSDRDFKAILLLGVIIISCLKLLSKFAFGSSVVSRNNLTIFKILIRSEERRVGKECRSRWSRNH